MSYLKIDNLYRRSDILQCFALLKVDGTSSHLSFKDGQVNFFAGGASHETFVALFDQEDLLARSKTVFSNSLVKDKLGLQSYHVVIHGEAFGGKVQGMSQFYGTKLRFIAFDVKINDCWLDVPDAEHIVKELGLDFVPFERGPLTIEWLNEQRDRPCRLSIVPNTKSEGIVVRPIYECRYNNGERMIFKHKTDEYRETKTPREVSPEQLAVLTEAGAVADEWIVPERLRHVLQKTTYTSVKDTGNVVKAMIEDVKLESVGEVVWSKDVERAIGKATVKLLQQISLG